MILDSRMGLILQYDSWCPRTALKTGAKQEVKLTGRKTLLDSRMGLISSTIYDAQ